MDTAVRHRIMRVEDFLAWECRQDDKYEFDGFEPVAMTGGSEPHAGIERNLAMALGARLRGQPCQFFGNSLKVVLANRVRYPDGQVVCSSGGPEATFTTAPVVLFEVVSPSSTATDYVLKRDDYRAIPSVMQYVVIEQDRFFVTVHRRSGDGWVMESLSRADTLHLPQLGFAIPIAEFYEGVVVAT